MLVIDRMIVPLPDPVLPMMVISTWMISFGYEVKLHWEESDRSICRNIFMTLTSQTNPFVNQENGSRISLEKLITKISLYFINLAFEEIDEGILRTLQSVSEYNHDDRAFIRLFTNNDQMMEAVYEWSAPDMESNVQSIRVQDVAHMPWFIHQIKNLQEVHLPDVHQIVQVSPLDFEECQSHGVRSILLLPLIEHGKAIGMLGFESVRAMKPWPGDVVDLLKIVAEIIANALSRKKTEEALNEAYQLMENRVEERTREIERRSQVGDALQDVLKVLNSNRPQEEVLQYIVTQACQLLDATATLIRKANLENQTVTTDAAYNLPADFDAIRYSKLYYNANDLILMSRRPVVISDIQTTYGPLLAIIDSLDDVQKVYTQALVKYYSGMLSVPLFIRNEIYGSLTFYFKEPREFLEEDIQLAMSMGDHAALAIENARLYRIEHDRRQEAERRRQVAESLRDIMAVLNSNRSLDEILQQIVGQAVNLLNTDAVGIYRLRDKEEVLSIRASQGVNTGYASQLRIPLGSGIAEYAIVSRKPVAISNGQAIPNQIDESNLSEEERQALRHLIHDYRAFLSVPLLGKDEIFGAITLYYQAERTFSEEEIELAVVFADQASLAIENAQLRAQTERNAVTMERNRIARDLHDAVTQTLFSASLIADVLPRLWERNPQEGRRRLEELRQLSRGALAEMRTLLLELRPSALLEAHLSELLKQLTEAITGRARLPLHLNVVGEFPLDPDVKVSLYRISQEALNNIVKHSGANQGWIDVHFIPASTSTQRRVELTIRDDGRGFDATKILPNHLGLGIMRERAQTINATLKIDSEPDQGTQITVIWEG